MNLIAPEGGHGTQGFSVALGVTGFVVTRLLLAEAAGWRGGLTVLARAALWVIPVMVLVCAVVLISGLLLLPPADLRNQAWTALWTAVGASGGELLKQGEWAPATSSELLLHLWIVGVAAQLVVGWTIVVVLLRALKAGRWIGWVALAGVIAAVALKMMMQGRGAAPQAFYLAPPHADLFLIGALIAMRRWPFARLLMKRPIGLLVLAGRLALPFWFWLWPMLAFPRLILARSPEPWEVGAALLTAAVLAVATERGVQRPLERRLDARPGPSLLICGVLLGSLAVASAALFALDGLPGRASAAVRAEEAAVLVRAPLQSRCHMEEAVIPSAALCTVPTAATADVILWGNSHASHLSPALLAWSESRGHAMRQATMSGCLTLMDLAIVSDACAHFNRQSIEEWGRVRPAMILLGAGWTRAFENASESEAARLDRLDRDLRETLALLRAKVGPRTRIVLLGTTPDYIVAPGACHARRAFLGLDTARCDLAAPDNTVLLTAIDARLAKIAAEEPGVTLFRPYDALCAQGLCRTRGQGGVWYSDRNHMTEAGGWAQTGALSVVLDHAMAGAEPR